MTMIRKHSPISIRRSLKPVMRLFPGDTVKTRTLDSRGHDRDGKPRAPRGNPLIGPFYVEGAMPGDTLVVHLPGAHQPRHRVSDQFDRHTALESGYLKSMAKYESGFHDWKIDAAAGIATVINPSDKLKPYSVKLSPMLGCIGVAPRGEETLGSGHLGPFGGNMDSPEIREGATFTFPSSAPARCFIWATAMPSRAMANCRARAWKPLWMCSSAWTWSANVFGPDAGGKC